LFEISAKLSEHGRAKDSDFSMFKNSGTNIEWRKIWWYADYLRSPSVVSHFHGFCLKFLLCDPKSLRRNFEQRIELCPYVFVSMPVCILKKMFCHFYADKRAGKAFVIPFHNVGVHEFFSRPRCQHFSVNRNCIDAADNQESRSA
jgi:hypothetical protein